MSSSSISFEQAMQALRGVNDVVNPDDDFYTLADAEGNHSRHRIKAKEATRRATRESQMLVLSPLASTLLKVLSAVPSAEAHSSALFHLDATRLSLGKSIKEAERLVASKEDQLATLKESVRRLEDCDPAAEHERDLDGAALRLLIYKRLGFEPVLDKHGELVKMLVRSQSGDIHVVPFSDGKTELEHTTALWKHMSS
ncbi:hypothetical protein C8F01DRAFT_1250721 [Mycena amicta]|nr:hypothetical protein C8F01DRAFT_1250721 [Mycena amicta]